MVPQQREKGVIEFPNTQLILSRREVAVDVETTGLHWWKDRVFGVSLSWWDERTDRPESFYGDIREGNIYKWMRDHLPRLQKVVNHNIKFDLHMLRESKIVIPLNRISCTMIREAIIDENKYEYGLDALSWKYLKRGKKDIWPELAKMFGGKPTKEEQAPNLVRAPREMVAEYANMDTANALEIHGHQDTIIREEELENIDALEQRLLGVVVRMEHGGVRVDVDKAEQSANFLDRDVRRQQKELDRLVGRPVNVNSAPQVKVILGVHQDENGNWWTKDKVRLEPTESGKSGSLKTEKLYQCTMPEARYIAEIRASIKARDTFLRKYILEMSHKEYIHANINQTRTEEGDGTYTGRFSITDPALQQIHKRNKKMAAIVRACFIPDEGAEWGCYDWAQKDFRIFGHYVNDPKINQIYADNPAADFHKVTSDITGLPRDRDEKTGGANAKQMNLGLIFGMSAGRMAKEMFLPYTLNEKGFYVAGPEAEELFSKYHRNIPGAERLKKSVGSVARSRGYIRTQLGRRLRFPDGNGAYKAAGILFQGQAAESMKVKMCELQDLVDARNAESPGTARFKLVVHDEFDLSLGLNRNREVDQEIKNLLQRFDGEETPLKYRIPVLSDFGLGPDWWEASK